MLQWTDEKTSWVHQHCEKKYPKYTNQSNQTFLPSTLKKWFKMKLWMSSKCLLSYRYCLIRFKSAMGKRWPDSLVHFANKPILNPKNLGNFFSSHTQFSLILSFNTYLIYLANIIKNSSHQNHNVPSLIFP